jgi:hypothetical protein
VKRLRGNVVEVFEELETAPSFLAFDAGNQELKRWRLAPSKKSKGLNNLELWHDTRIREKLGTQLQIHKTHPAPEVLI